MENTESHQIIVRLLNKMQLLKERLTKDNIVYVPAHSKKETKKNTTIYKISIGDKAKYREILKDTSIAKAFKLHNPKLNMLFCIIDLPDTAIAGVIYFDHSKISYYNTSEPGELITLIPNRDFITRAETSCKIRKSDFCCNPGCTITGICKKQCGRCRGVVYCSVACQHAHWSLHKSTCRPYVPLEPPRSTDAKQPEQTVGPYELD